VKHLSRHALTAHRGSSTIQAMSESPRSEITVATRLRTASVTIRDVCCLGRCRHKSAVETSTRTHLVYPYRGVYVRHVGSDDAVAEPNQVLFFNATEEYQVSHPVVGGDACFVLEPADSVLSELTPKELAIGGARPRMRRQRSTIDSRAQVLAALLRHSLATHVVEPLEAEGLALTLIRRTLGPRTAREPKGSVGRRKLVDRAKLTLAQDLRRRWTLAEIAQEVGVSPVYLTQVFQQVEGLPLYRYQLRLRLAQALALLEEYDDLSNLATDLGFAHHSHFTSAFRQAYGRSPSEFKHSVRR
jgi:AraC-like DNA-binding protein